MFRHHNVQCPKGLCWLQRCSLPEDLANVISQRQLSDHLYADDTQLLKRVCLTDIPIVIDRLQHCVQEIHGWCALRRLQLNPAKTELIGFGSRTDIRKCRLVDLSLHVGAETIKSVTVSAVRDLGVILDDELTMKPHISKVTSIASITSDD